MAQKLIVLESEEQELRDLQGTARLLSEEEQKRKTKELGGKDSSYILRKFDLD